MKKIGRKAFMKTIEILLVIVFTSIFLLALIQKQFSTSVNEKSQYLMELEKVSEFRDYISHNTGCFNSTQEGYSYIRRYLPTRFDFILCISAKPLELPQKDINVNSMYFTGNLTFPQSKTVRLYYWI